jgi:hypothetical protein
MPRSPRLNILPTVSINSWDIRAKKLYSSQAGKKEKDKAVED